MFIRSKNAQSTVEYVILVAAVIAILLLFLKQGGTFRNALEKTYNKATDGMEDMATRLRNSRPGGQQGPGIPD